MKVLSGCQMFKIQRGRWPRSAEGTFSLPCGSSSQMAFGQPNIPKKSEIFKNIRKFESIRNIRKYSENSKISEIFKSYWSFSFLINFVSKIPIVDIL